VPPWLRFRSPPGGRASSRTMPPCSTRACCSGDDNEGEVPANAGRGTIIRGKIVAAIFCIREPRTSRVAVTTVVSATVLLALTVTSLGSAPRDWPPFLRASDAYPLHIANAVRRLSTDATFTRTVSAEPAPVPLGFYLRFVDAPDVAAAAARHLRLTTYDVKVLGDDWYEADGGGAHGVYRVLLRDGGRRVILSWGSHRGSILGTVGGSALTRLEFADEDGRSAQRLTVNVILDNGVAAGITHALLPLFGWFVDRKLTEGFRTTAAAAAWAHAKPDEFCAWLGGAFAADRRAELVEVFDECTSRFAVTPSVGVSHTDGSASESPGARRRPTAP